LKDSERKRGTEKREIHREIEREEMRQKDK